MRNVLWICADDYAPYVCGAYGDPLARTPNLDRLASQGIRFDRAYCACPLSTPSRMAFLTGRYPRSVGVTLSRASLPMDEITLGGLLSRADYETVALGKTHYYDPLEGEFTRCMDLVEHRSWLAALRERSGRTAAPGEVLGPWMPFASPASEWLNAAGLPYAPDDEMPDTFFTNAAEKYLDGRPGGPFFLWVGFYVTHSPFRFPIEFRGRFDPSRFTPPPVGPEDAARIPGVFRDLTDADKRGITASYYTCVEYMDRNVGRILDALDRSGLADETLVVFNSDHGYLLGHHGRFEKHCGFEEAIRTALLVRLPGVVEPGRSTDALVELIDVVPTILDLCGIDAPASLQGRSLVPLLTGAADRHRDHIIAEYADAAEAIVRTDRWKLIYTAGVRRRGDGYELPLDGPPRPRGPSIRLYDLAADPGETTDASARPENAGVVADLIATLVDHARRTERNPRRLPDTDDPTALLAAALPPPPFPW